MKFNKWTLGLAAVGAVSMASAVRADEAKLTQLNTAISNTTLSGVVDVAAEYNTGNVHNYGNYNLDSFSVNQVIISLDKPLDESPWASGYHVDLNWGSQAVQPLATAYGYSESYYNDGNPLRQAYVTMRTPLGNGIDWKAGLFDNILGYESNTLAANPNYSHSYGWNAEPTSQLGLIGTYKVCDLVTVTGGLANSYNGYYSNGSVSEKTFLGAATFTAPDSWGWAKGAALSLGANQGFYKGTVNNYYAGLTLPTPVKALTVGAAFDLVSDIDAHPTGDVSEWIVGTYATFQATDKLSFSARGEYSNGYSENDGRGEEVTLTTAYNLWANIVSRIELRWDHSDHNQNLGYYGQDSNGNYDGDRGNDFTVAFNVAYKF
jgi:hypothetical protein